MKNGMKKAMGALALAVLMLISAGMTFAAPAVAGNGTVSSATASTVSIDNAKATTVSTAFGLDMTASLNADDSSLIDVVISVKDIQQELDAVEFVLDFDQRYVSGVITENGDPMNAFMTVTPMYTYVIPGASSMEVPVTRYEQICTYDAVDGKYVCRFLDLLDYSCAKPGEVYKGLSEDGDLVVTIQFRIKDTVADGTAIKFTASDVKGTTTNGLKSVSGSAATATYTKKTAVAVPTITLNYPTLSFEDEIFYNVYFSVKDMSNVEEMGLMLLSSRNDAATIKDAIDTVPGYITNGSVYMARSESVPAAHLGDTIYFKVYAKLTNGTYVYSTAGGYNAKAYANSILSGDNTAQMKSLVVAMLNYGADAQKYFGHNLDKLVNSSLTSAQKALVKAYNEAMVDPIVAVDSAKVGGFVRDNANIKSLYPSVSFDGAFAINFYCTPAISVDSNVTLYWWDAETYASISRFTLGNATGKMQMSKTGSQYWGEVPGIAAKDIDKTYYVTCVFQNNGNYITTGIIPYSLGKYCEGKAATNGDDLQAFAQATAVYGYYAKQLFYQA